LQGRRWGGLLIDKVTGHSLVPSFTRTVLLLLATGGMALLVHAGDASELLEARVREQTDNKLGGLERDRRSSFAAAVLVHDGRLALAPRLWRGGSCLDGAFRRVERVAQSMRLDGKDGFVEVAPGTSGNPDYLETFSFIRNSRTNKIS
jgi:hypothetical protein